MLEKIHDILHFWFGEKDTPYDQVASNWWQKNEDFDNQIRVEFEPVIDYANKGKLNVWLDQPLGCLAYIILLDQFPRNIYRNTPKSFSFDEKAKLACLHGIENEYDKDLDLVQRQFMYMPLMHSEDIEDQKHCVAIFHKLLTLADEEQPQYKNMMKSGYEFAVSHFEIVNRFGRYPHRNKILGRESTPEEIAFLKGPNSGF